MLNLHMINAPYKIPSQWQIAPSATAHHILLFVTSGSIRYQFGEDTRLLQKNDWVFIPIGTHRSATACPPHYHRMVSAHFQWKEASEPPFPLLLQQQEVKQLRPQNTEYVKQRFAALSELWSSRLPYYELQGQAIVLELLALMSRELDQSRHHPDKLHMVQHMQTYIETHYRERITLQQVADIIDRSPNYACHLFKQITGLGPIDYANQTRLNRARELLHQTDLTVAEVAHACGFTDPYYFSKLYKRVYGASPKQSMME
ncbi:helix-turn-helix domain-containing protein [Paenibacillus sp. 1P07SE]|uniref:helix-turn-helix domain-containing protein n=1 Tax=Paenibacillus sp. 1P07SE TaxID=3132209 RepID=UPI0039A54C2E